MLKFLYSLLYLIVLGILAFPFGRILALKKWNPYAFPFKEYSWEDGGKLYERALKIKSWKTRVPDVSKAVPWIVPKKTISMLSGDRLDLMIQETCVAELTHLILCPLSVPVICIMDNIGGVVLFILDVIFGNLSFMVIQRYNRFRYLRTRRKIESINSECKYRNRS